MSDYEKADQEVLSMPYKNHGPGGELPTFASLTAKPAKKDKPMDASWEPVKPNPNEAEKLKACVMHTLPIAALSGVVFWWQQTGALVEATGFYALIVLAALAGLTIGKYMLR